MSDSQPEEPVVLSTESQLRTFKESSIWEDMQKELHLWMLMLQTSYDNCDSLSEVKLIQGRREAVRHLLALPDNLLEGAKAQREKEKEERDGKRM